VLETADAGTTDGNGAVPDADTAGADTVPDAATTERADATAGATADTISEVDIIPGTDML
jgi:hypothetical protein